VALFSETVENDYVVKKRSVWKSNMRVTGVSVLLERTPIQISLSLHLPTPVHAAKQHRILTVTLRAN
jgi:hypothetical protein